MSIDHDLSTHFKSSAGSFRPAPGDLDTVVRHGRRRLRRRRVGGSGVVVLVLLMAATASPAVSIAGPGVVATEQTVTDGGVPVTVIDIPVDGTVAVSGGEGFMLLEDTDNRALGFWERMADRLGWFPDLAVYTSVDGRNWDRSTHSDAVFDDVAYIVDAVTVDGTVTLLGGVVASEDPTAPPTYRLLQTRDFEAWSSANVPVAGPGILPEGLEWWIQGARLVAAGDRPAVVASVFPNVTGEFRSESWGYDSVDGWTASTRDGRSLSIPLEAVTPTGTDPSRTMVMTADIGDRSNATDGSFDIIGPVPGAEVGEMLVDVGFLNGSWTAITSGPSGEHKVWESDSESEWELRGSVATLASALTADGVVALVADDATWQLTLLEDEGNWTPLGGPFGDTTKAAPLLMVSRTTIVAVFERSAWVYPSGESTERNLDFPGWAQLPASIDGMTGTDREAEVELVEALVTGDDNHLIPSRLVSGGALLGTRTYSPDSWWVFDLG